MSSSHLSAELTSVPYEQRWELLRPVIQQLYMNESKKLADVIRIIKDHSSFVAVWVPTTFLMNTSYLHKMSASLLIDLCRLVSLNTSTKSRNGDWKGVHPSLRRKQSAELSKTGCVKGRLRWSSAVQRILISRIFSVILRARQELSHCSLLPLECREVRTDRWWISSISAIGCKFLLLIHALSPSTQSVS